MSSAEQITELSDYVERYRVCDLNNGYGLSLLLRNITGLLYFLETERASIHEQFESEVFNLTNKQKGEKSLACSRWRKENKHVEFFIKCIIMV